MVSDPFLVGVFYGLVPAMGFLYILLHRYEGLFNERKAFFSFFIGLAAGLIGTLLQLVMGPATSAPLWLLGLYSLLFGAINALLMTMGLNSKRFRAQRDTPFYGVAYGLGFGAMYVLFFVGKAVNERALSDAALSVEVVGLTILGVYFIAGILVHACVGAIIGRGTSTRGVVDALIPAALFESVYAAGFYALFILPASSVLPFLAIVLSIFFVRSILKRVLDPLVPPALLREMEIHRRRLARRTMRESSPPNGNDPDAARRGDSPDAEGPAPDPKTPVP